MVLTTLSNSNFNIGCSVGPSVSTYKNSIMWTLKACAVCVCVSLWSVEYGVHDIRYSIYKRWTNTNIPLLYYESRDTFCDVRCRVSEGTFKGPSYVVHR